MENLSNANCNSLVDIVEPFDETFETPSTKKDVSSTYLQRKYPFQNILLTKTPSNSSTDNIEFLNELSSTGSNISGTSNNSVSAKHNLKFQRKNEKIIENLSWNISIIKIELDHLNRIKNECINTFQQVCFLFLNLFIFNF